MTSYSTKAQEPNFNQGDLIALAHLLDNLPKDFKNQLKNYFENSQDQLETMKVVKCIELLNFTNKSGQSLIPHLEDNSILEQNLPNYNYTTDFIRKSLITLTGNLPTFKQHIEFIRETHRKRYLCAVSFPETTIILQYDEFYNSFNSLKNSPLYKQLKNLEILASKQSNTFYCTRAQSTLRKSIKYNQDKLKTQNVTSNDLLKKHYIDTIKEQTKTLCLLKQKIYMHDFAKLLFECIQIIFNACNTTKHQLQQAPLYHFSLPRVLQSFPRPGDIDDTNYEEKKPLERRWSHDDCDFSDNFKRTANDKVQKWPSTNEEPIRQNTRREENTKEINKNNLRILNETLAEEPDQCKREFISLAIQYFQIISDETMTYAQKATRLSMMYRTPERLLNLKKRLVGYTKTKDKDGVIRFVHHLPEDLMKERSGALSSSRSRKAAIKRASFSQEVQYGYRDEINKLDYNYFPETMNHQFKMTGENRIYREKIIFKAFQFLFSYKLLDLNVVESIFRKNNCAFLKYAENVIEGSNSNIEKYDLGALLFEYFD